MSSDRLERDRFIKIHSIPISIESIESRSLIQYPNPDNYRINLGRIFENVKRVPLIDIQIPCPKMKIMGESQIQMQD